jgi:hypothetical protein
VVDRRRRFGESRRLGIGIVWIGRRWRWRWSALLEVRWRVRDVFLSVRGLLGSLRRCEMVHGRQAAIEDEWGFVMTVERSVALLLRGCREVLEIGYSRIVMILTIDLVFSWTWRPSSSALPSLDLRTRRGYPCSGNVTDNDFSVTMRYGVMFEMICVRMRTIQLLERYE